MGAPESQALLALHALHESSPLAPASRTDSFQILMPAAKLDEKSSSVLSRVNWSRDLLGISVVYFVEGMLAMTSLAVSYYLKDALGLTPAEAGIATTAGQIPWELTPLLGMLTDTIPIFGYHCKAYLLLVGLLGCSSWLLLGFVRHIVPTVAVIFVGNACTAWSQVVADGIMVKMCQGHQQDVASFYQALSWVTYTVGAVTSGYTVGELIDHYGPVPAFLLSAGGLLLDAACAFLVSERPAPAAKPSMPSADVVTAVRHAQHTVRELLRRVWSTIWIPHIFFPALFIFLWQATPSPDTAMFYFQTEVLHFSPEFQEVVYLCGYIAGFTGLAAYQAFLVNSSMRVMLLGCSLAGFIFNTTQLVLVSRINLKLGLSDKVFVLGDYTMLSTISEVMMTPMMAMAARACPEGVEATLYACLYMLLNLSTAIATALGALCTHLFGVTSSDFSHMFWLVLFCNLCMLLPLPLLCRVPAGTDLPKASPEGLPRPGAWEGEGQEAAQVHGARMLPGGSRHVDGFTDLGELEEEPSEDASENSPLLQESKSLPLRERQHVRTQ